MKRIITFSIFVFCTYCVFSQNNANWCPGNLFVNGEFLGNPSLDHQDIDSAAGWLPIWTGNSLADLYPSTHSPIGPLPFPPSGNYASCWIVSESMGSEWREGMFGLLDRLIPANSGSYSFTFDVATLARQGTSNPMIGVYGIYNDPPQRSPLTPSGIFTPPNEAFFGAANTMLLGSRQVPAAALGSKQPIVINFDSSDPSFPINGITHILITNDGTNSGGKSYCAFDNFCMQLADPISACCDSICELTESLIHEGDSLKLQLSSSTSTIQEVEVAMMDYHVQYSDSLCQPSNIGRLGLLSTSTNQIGTQLSLETFPSGAGHVLSWNNGTPTVLNNAEILLSVSKPNVVNLSCCSVKFYYCLKITAKDVNCNVCEKIVCDSIVPSSDLTQCNCPTNKQRIGNSISINGASNITDICSGTSVVPAGNYTVSFPSFVGCNTTSCTPTYNWRVYGNGGVILRDVIGSSNASTAQISFNPGNTYRVFSYALCGGQVCDSCWVTIRVPSEPKCDCMSYNSDIIFRNSSNIMAGSIQCDGTINLPVGSYSINIPFTCPDPACSSQYNWAISGSGVGNGSTNPVNYNFSTAGWYFLTITPRCGSTTCRPCTIHINITPSSLPCEIQSTMTVTCTPTPNTYNYSLSFNSSLSGTFRLSGCSVALPLTGRTVDLGPNLFTHTGDGTPGNYSCDAWVISGSDSCKVKLNFVVPSCNTCACGSWEKGSGGFSIGGTRIGCDVSPILEFNSGNTTLTANTFNCIGNCQATYEWIIQQDGGNTATRIYGRQVNFNFVGGRKYDVSLIVKCGKRTCVSCLSNIKIKKGGIPTKK